MTEGIASSGSRRYLAYGIAASLLGLWALTAFRVWQFTGLFWWLGIDYGGISVAANVFLEKGPTALYDADVVLRSAEALSGYYGPIAGALTIGTAPYPPPFYLLYAPFSVLPPAIGFLLWTLANVTLAIWLIRSLDSRFSQRSWARVMIVLAWFPLMYAFWLGHTVLWAVVLHRAYRNLEDGREFRSGLWIGLLLLKPQFGLFLALVLIYKRRWAALAGFGLVGLLLALASLGMFLPDGLPTYLAMWQGKTQFWATEHNMHAQSMITWRGLLVNVLPQTTPDAQAMAITLVLSGLTASSLLLVWRGPWNPRDERFATRMFATIVVTMLASIHNHAFGAMLLLGPGMVLAAQGGGPRPLQALLRVAVYAPTLVFVITTATELVAICMISLLAVALVAVLTDEVRVWMSERTRLGHADHPRQTIRALTWTRAITPSS